MGKKRIRYAVALVGALLVAAATVGAYASLHKSGSKSAADGIVVHGDWKIVVKNPDGSVAGVHRFHNAFNGANLMARSFAHQATPGRFWLQVADTSGTNNPCEVSVSGSPVQVTCNDFEADDPNAGGAANFFGNLTASSNASNNLVVQGEFDAQRNGQFDRVLMRMSSCTNSTAPSACHPNGYQSWSDRTLPSPITLVDGQQALVTVTYTFSPA
jgi:hypothetical protein